VCGANGVDTARALGVKPGTLLYADFRSFGKATLGPAPLPSPSDVRRRVRAMTGSAATAFYAWRGIGWQVRRRYMIGWDGAHQNYCLPVFASKGGPVINVRSCPLRGKLHGLRGRGVQVYPYPPPGGRWALVCEGEWDCLRARQAGLPAYTSTGGAATWKPEWSVHFRGMPVVVCMDSDLPGRAGAQRVAAALEAYAQVSVLDLAPGRNDGYDLSDFLSNSSVDQLKGRIRKSLGKEKARGRSSNSH